MIDLEGLSTSSGMAEFDRQYITSC